ncbi:MAG: hypothetical protein KKC14_10985 [Alphaproteobacteria bacterium]|nr:hypothetical protein [Alphaproteobacteria bacterium]
MASTLPVLANLKTRPVNPEAAPYLMVGAVSPLWLMFGGAAAAGATWWWWASRWRQAVNLEAISALAPEPLAPPVEAWVEPVAEFVVEPAQDLAAEVLTQPLEIVAEATIETLYAVVSAGEVVAESMVEAMVEVVETAEPVETVELVAAVEPAAPELAPPVEMAAALEPSLALEAPIEAQVEVAVEVDKAVEDDLTRVVGIGPKLAASLGELGVTRFSQIAAWTAEDLQSIDQLLGLKGRADRDAWVAQAKRFVVPEA